MKINGGPKCCSILQYVFEYCHCPLPGLVLGLAASWFASRLCQDLDTSMDVYSIGTQMAWMSTVSGHKWRGCLQYRDTNSMNAHSIWTQIT